LGADGLADVSKKLENGDIFVNKYCPIITEEARAMMSQNMQDNIAFEYRQQPESYKGALPAYVDRVILTSTNEEPYLIKMIQR